MSAKTVAGTKIATVVLEGVETSVSFEHAYKAFSVQNLGDDTIYISDKSGITPGADGVIAIPSGGSTVIDANSDTVYFFGSGTAQINAQYDKINRFKASPKGGVSGLRTGTIEYGGTELECTIGELEEVTA